MTEKHLTIQTNFVFTPNLKSHCTMTMRAIYNVIRWSLFILTQNIRKPVNQLTVSAKRSTLGVLQGSKHPSAKSDEVLLCEYSAK